MLYNGELFWPKTFNKRQYRDEVTHAEVLIIGGGMSGALLGYTFAKAGYRTLLVDKGQVAGESSSANTGLLQYMSDKSMHECIQDFGEQAAYHFYRQSYEGLQLIRELCEELPDDVQFINRDSVLYASHKKHNKFLKKEYVTLRKYGLPCELLSEEEMKRAYGIEAMGLITHADAEINPYVFIQRLLEKAVDAFGLHICEQTEVVDWKEQKDGTVIVKAVGQTFSADHVIYAGGYADNKLSQTIKKRKLVRSYALVSKPISDEFWKDRAMIWETARPYLYIRHVEGNRIIVGGLDDNNKRVPSERRIHRKTDQLQQLFYQLFPDIEIEIEERYGARFGETKDGLPFIGRVPGKSSCYMLLGYGGNGTVYSAFGSRLLLHMVQGQVDEWHEIFKLDR